MVDGTCEKAILCCGTGIGISMAANKVKGIRAACCSDYFSAKYTRAHNDANVLCMGDRVVGAGLALELVQVFLTTPLRVAATRPVLTRLWTLRQGRSSTEFKTEKSAQAIACALFYLYIYIGVSILVQIFS